MKLVPSEERAAAGGSHGKPTTAVIGAGAGGLVTCKALVDQGIPFVCYESSDDVGGIWYFRNPNGRSAAYRSLHFNISRRWLSFRDYPLAEDFPDFPHHTRVHGYLRDYADAFGLRPSIRFQTTVEQAERLPDGGWRLSLSDGEVAHFDALVVCNGHHWDPSLPNPPFPGRFEGHVIHSFDYVDPTEPLDFKGMRVLVVGIGNSAVDIACELSRKDVAARVVLSTRSSAWILPKYAFGRPFDQVARIVPWFPLAPQRRIGGLLVRLLSGHPKRFGLPTPNHRFLESDPTISGELLAKLGCKDVIAKPNVAELCGDCVRFADNSEEPFDVIVYATGYKVSFPFFDEELIAAPGNVLPLYKRLFKPGLDDLAFVGLAEPLPSQFHFAESQSKLLAMWLAGEWALPPMNEMQAAIDEDDRRHTGHYTPRPRHAMQHLVSVYERDLIKHVIPAGRRRASQGMQGPNGPLAGRATRVDLVAAKEDIGV